MLHLQGRSPYKTLYLISCVLQILILPIRLVSLAYFSQPEPLNRLQAIEESILLLTVPVCWTMILYFLRWIFLVNSLYASSLVLYLTTHCNGDVLIAAE